MTSFDAVARRLRGMRISTPQRVVSIHQDPTAYSFEASGYKVLGDDVATGLPLFDRIKASFAAALPPSKHVRVDTPESYQAFREERRQPYLAALEARIAALETAFRRHLSEEHHIDALGEAAVRACGAARAGGERIPVPEWARDTMAAWRDGGEILCTIRYADRMLTTGEPLDRHMEKAVAAADAEDLGIDEVIAVVPAVAQVVGAGWILRDLIGAAKQIVYSGHHVGVMSSGTDVNAAATMALLQRCQQGDVQACREARRLDIREAHRRLMQGQEDKRHRWRTAS